MKAFIMSYSPDEIRTGNMPALRDTDLVFDEKIEPSKTQQQFADETDVNRIVASNAFIPADVSQLHFADVSEVIAYDEALNVVMKAQDSFNGLQAEIRARFNNNPSEFVNFLANPDNVQEAIKLGLMVEATPASQPTKNLTPAPLDPPQA